MMNNIEYNLDQILYWDLKQYHVSSHHYYDETGKYYYGVVFRRPTSSKTKGLDDIMVHNGKYNDLSDLVQTRVYKKDNKYHRELAPAHIKYSKTGSIIKAYWYSNGINITEDIMKYAKDNDILLNYDVNEFNCICNIMFTRNFTKEEEIYLSLKYW